MPRTRENREDFLEEDVVETGGTPALLDGSRDEGLEAFFVDDGDPE